MKQDNLTLFFTNLLGRIFSIFANKNSRKRSLVWNKLMDSMKLGRVNVPLDCLIHKKALLSKLGPLNLVNAGHTFILDKDQVGPWTLVSLLKDFALIFDLCWRIETTSYYGWRDLPQARFSDAALTCSSLLNSRSSWDI